MLLRAMISLTKTGVNALMTQRSHHDHERRRIDQLTRELADNPDLLIAIRQLIGDSNLSFLGQNRMDNLLESSQLPNPPGAFLLRAAQYHGAVNREADHSGRQKALVRQHIEKIDGVTRTWFEWALEEGSMTKTLVDEVEFDIDPNNVNMNFFNAIMDTAVGVLQDETMVTVSHLKIYPG